MAEIPRFCAGCFDITNQVSRVIKYKFEDDLYMCPSCKLNVQAHQTYTQREVLGQLQLQIDSIIELMQDIEELE